MENSELEIENIEWNPPLETVANVESWARDFAAIDAESAWWKSRMASVLYQLSGHGSARVTKQDARVRAQEALKLDPDNWHTSYTLAQVVEKNDESIALLNSVIDRLLGDDTWRNDPENKKRLAEVYLTLGDKYWYSAEDNEKLIDPSKSIEACLRSLDEFMGFHDRLVQILARCALQKMWPEAVSILEKMRDTPVSSEDRKHKANPDFEQVAYKTFLGWYGFIDGLTQCAKALNRWDLVKQTFEAGLRVAEGLMDKFRIRYHYGASLRRSENPDQGFRTWEALLDEAMKNEKEPEECENFMDWYLVESMMPELIKRATPADASSTTASTASLRSSREYVAKIEAFFQRFTSWQSRAPDPGRGLWFSRFYVRRGDMETAKAAAREQVRIALEMIDNDDPSDDRDSFWSLGTVFSTFGDVVNARGAFIMMKVARLAEWDAYKEEMKKYERDLAAWNARHTKIENLKPEGGDGSTQPPEEDESGAKIDTSEEVVDSSNAVVVVAVDLEAAEVTVPATDSKPMDETPSQDTPATSSLDDKTTSGTADAAAEVSVAIDTEEAVPTGEAEATSEESRVEAEAEAEPADTAPEPPSEPFHGIGVFCDGVCDPTVRWDWPRAMWTCKDDIGNKQVSYT